MAKEKRENRYQDGKEDKPARSRRRLPEYSEQLCSECGEVIAYSRCPECGYVNE